MGENSSGSNRTNAAEESLTEQFSRKTRSFSLGSVKQKLSVAEINKIIYGTDNKNSKPQWNTDNDTLKLTDGNNRKLITPTDGEITNKTELQGYFKKCDFNKESQEDVFNDPNSVFKPRKSVQRTPPPTPSSKCDIISTEITNKRQRGESSPGTENDNKRPRDGQNLKKSNKILEEDTVFSSEKENEPQDERNLEKLLVEIYSSLDILQQSVNQENQDGIRNATFLIQKNLAFVTYKIGKLEQEKMNLEHELHIRKLQTVDNVTTSHKDQAETSLPQKTYANITQKPAAKSSIRQETETKTWTTPKTTRKLETVIRMENISDPKETMRHIKSQMKTSDLEGGVKNIRQLKSGAIVVESYNLAQQDKIKIALGTKENIKIKETSNINPMFMITGILKGYSNSEFIEELIRLNSEIEVEFPSIDLAKVIKVITKRDCRNPTKENWILEAPPSIAKWFLKKETILFDLMKVYVQEHFNLAQCYNCSGFGHVGKYCKETMCCYKCSGTNHTGIDCNATNLKCTNCVKMKYGEEFTQHTARDINCPVYQKRLSNYKNQINYSDSFL